MKDRRKSGRWLRQDPPLVLAVLCSIAFFVYAVLVVRPGMAAPEVFYVRYGAAAAILFLLLAGIFRALGRDIRREIAKEGGGGAEVRREVVWFAVVKALVRCLLGVTLVLGWLAGLILCLTVPLPGGRPLAVLAATGFSAVMFLLAVNLVEFMDRLRLPPED